MMVLSFIVIKNILPRLKDKMYLFVLQILMKIMILILILIDYNIKELK